MKKDAPYRIFSPAGVDLSDGVNTNPLVNAEMSSLFSTAKAAINDLEAVIHNEIEPDKRTLADPSVR